MRWEIEYTSKRIKHGKLEFEGNSEVALYHMEKLFNKFKILRFNLRRIN
jgi:hypothetical protein